MCFVSAAWILPFSWILSEHLPANTIYGEWPWAEWRRGCLGCLGDQHHTADPLLICQISRKSGGETWRQLAIKECWEPKSSCREKMDCTFLTGQKSPCRKMCLALFASSWLFWQILNAPRCVTEELWFLYQLPMFMVLSPFPSPPKQTLTGSNYCDLKVSKNFRMTGLLWALKSKSLKKRARRNQASDKPVKNKTLKLFLSCSFGLSGRLCCSCCFPSILPLKAWVITSFKWHQWEFLKPFSIVVQRNMNDNIRFCRECHLCIRIKKENSKIFRKMTLNVHFLSCCCGLRCQE